MSLRCHFYKGTLIDVNSVTLVVTPWGSGWCCRLFGGTCCLHIQGRTELASIINHRGSLNSARYTDVYTNNSEKHNSPAAAARYAHMRQRVVGIRIVTPSRPPLQCADTGSSHLHGHSASLPPGPETEPAPATDLAVRILPHKCTLMIHICTIFVMKYIISTPSLT